MPKRLTNTSANAILLLLLMVIIWVVPCKVTKTSYCQYCRAQKHSTRYMGLIERTKITENRLTWYWRKSIDANHKHAWRLEDMQRSSLVRPLASGSCARVDYSRLVYMSVDIEIAIFSSFNTPAERMAFADSFLYWDNEKPVAESQQRAKAMEHLQQFSARKHESKDWQKILKNLGVIK